jgi:hypothetical protein
MHGLAQARPEVDRPRTFAEPVGAARLPERRGFGVRLETRLVLNSTKDRAGAMVSLCGRPSIDDVPDCSNLLYSFPELRVDADEKEIRWKDEVVATYGLFGIRMRKGFRLVAEAVPEVVDDGFNRKIVEQYVVFIERVGEE